MERDKCIEMAADVITELSGFSSEETLHTLCLAISSSVSSLFPEKRDRDDYMDKFSEVVKGAMDHLERVRYAKLM